MRVTANIATFPAESRKRSLLKTLDSLTDQVDLIRVYFNGYDEAPEWVRGRYTNLLAITGPNDYTDNAKFIGLSMLDEGNEFYFTCDDDIVYPKDYVAKTVQAIAKHNSIVTYHGRKLNNTGGNYYTSHTSYRCLGLVTSDIKIDVAGTGVTAFSTEYFRPQGLHRSYNLRMSDLVLSYQAALEGKRIICLAHEAGYIGYGLPLDDKSTIYEHFKLEPTPVQDALALDIYKLNNGN